MSDQLNCTLQPIRITTDACAYDLWRSISVLIYLRIFTSNFSEKINFYDANTKHASIEL